MSVPYAKTVRLGKDNYKRPQMTYTDKLSKERIEELLEDYKQADIKQIPLNTHVRYFVVKDGKQKFRTGGMLVNNSGLPKYVILSNGANRWSVQVANAVFFRKMAIEEIKQEYEQVIDKLEQTNAGLRHMVKGLKAELAELRK